MFMGNEKIFGKIFGKMLLNVLNILNSLVNGKAMIERLNTLI